MRVTEQNKKLFFLGIVILVALQWSGCEDDFQKLTENDKYAYSMSGVLDLHADTQWVRMMPINKTLLARNTENNVTSVTITREKTGETSRLNDSLFVFNNNVRVWNYWTTMPLHPNEKYTVRAEGEDGTVSATVSIPSPLPVPVVKTEAENEEEEECIPVVKGSSDTPLVTADLKFYYRLTSFGKVTGMQELSVSHLDKISRKPNGLYKFKFDTLETMFEEIGRNPDDDEGYIIEEIQLIVATGNEDYPDYSDFTEEEAVLPGTISNVENGTGFVAGIARRIVPLQSCYDDQGNLAPCEEIK